jgi:hypothetical protein
MIEHLGRGRATVDIVPEQDDKPGAARGGDIGGDPCFGTLQEVEAAMDVANGIDGIGSRPFAKINPSATRWRRLACLGPGKPTDDLAHVFRSLCGEDFK